MTIFVTFLRLFLKIFLFFISFFFAAKVSFKIFTFQDETYSFYVFVCVCVFVWQKKIHCRRTWIGLNSDYARSIALLPSLHSPSKRSFVVCRAPFVMRFTLKSTLPSLSIYISNPYFLEDVDVTADKEGDDLYKMSLNLLDLNQYHLLDFEHVFLWRM